MIRMYVTCRRYWIKTRIKLNRPQTGRWIWVVVLAWLAIAVTMTMKNVTNRLLKISLSRFSLNMHILLRYIFSFFFFFFSIYGWTFYRQAQFHVTTPQRIIRLCIIANSAAHTSPGCVHSNSYRRSSPGGSLTIRAGHCIAMPHDPNTLAQH